MENLNLPVGFYFSLSMAGVDVAWQEVSGIEKKLNVEDVVCGGENRFKYRLPTATTFQNLILKRGAVLKASPLVAWCKKTLDTGLTASIVTKDVQVNLLDTTGTVNTSWTFINAYPVRWATSDLQSQENKILIETIELAYNYFEIE